MTGSSVIGVDLGGTKSEVARFDATTGKVQETALLPTRAERGFADVLEDVVQLVQQLRAPDTKAVGIGVPGLVKQPDGVLLKAPNIPDSENIPIREILRAKLGLPVSVANDAQCFALAEALHGAGDGHRVVVGITMGTGVGGGIVIDGTLFTGNDGWAGEIGHMLLMPGKPPYRTKDKRGDAEQFLSGSAMGERCKAAKRPKEYLEGEVCAFLQPEIFREAAWLCASITHLLNPAIIVFGGSAGKALKPHLTEIKKELSAWVLPGTPLPILTTSSLDHAAMLGAALLSRVA